jgi:hypothetical protein
VLVVEISTLVTSESATRGERHRAGEAGVWVCTLAMSLAAIPNLLRAGGKNTTDDGGDELLLFGTYSPLCALLFFVVYISRLL